MIPGPCCGRSVSAGNWNGDIRVSVNVAKDGPTMEGATRELNVNPLGA